MINLDDLEQWSDSAAQLIQDYIDEAEASSHSPGDVAHVEKTLLYEYEAIKKGQPTWQAKIATHNKDCQINFEE